MGEGAVSRDLEAEFGSRGLPGKWTRPCSYYYLDGVVVAGVRMRLCQV